MLELYWHAPIHQHQQTLWIWNGNMKHYQFLCRMTHLEAHGLLFLMIVSNLVHKIRPLGKIVTRIGLEYRPRRIRWNGIMWRIPYKLVHQYQTSMQTRNIYLVK